jgi:hypothetical protein
MRMQGIRPPEVNQGSNTFATLRYIGLHPGGCTSCLSEYFLSEGYLDAARAHQTGCLVSESGDFCGLAKSWNHIFM